MNQNNFNNSTEGLAGSAVNFDVEWEDQCPPGSLLDKASVRAGLIVIYSIVLAFCLFGNLLLLIVIAVQKSMRSSTNFFLGNLAVADLLVGVFCVVQNLCHLFVFSGGHWPLGATMCHLYIFILHFVPCTSAGILVLLSIERYIVVLYPMWAKTLLSRNLLGTLTAFVWVVSIAANIPFYITAKYWHEYSSCGRDFEGPIDLKSMYTINFVLWYCLPLVCLAYLYTRIGIRLWKTTTHGAAFESARRRSSNFNCGDSVGAGLKRARANSATPVLIGNEDDHSSTTTWPTPPYQPKDDTSKNGISEKRYLRDTSTVSMNPNAGVGSKIRNDLVKVIPRKSVQSTNGSSLKGGRGQSISSGACAGGSRNISDMLEARKRVVRLLISVILAFSLLTLPNHARLLWTGWAVNIRVCPSSPISLIQPISFLLLFSNSGINPLLYAFLSRRFRQAVLNLIQCRPNHSSVGTMGCSTNNNNYAGRRQSSGRIVRDKYNHSTTNNCTTTNSQTASILKQTYSNNDGASGNEELRKNGSKIIPSQPPQVIILPESAL